MSNYWTQINTSGLRRGERMQAKSSCISATRFQTSQKNSKQRQRRKKTHDPNATSSDGDQAQNHCHATLRLTCRKICNHNNCKTVSLFATGAVKLGKTHKREVLSLSKSRFRFRHFHKFRLHRRRGWPYRLANVLRHCFHRISSLNLLVHPILVLKLKRPSLLHLHFEGGGAFEVSIQVDCRARNMRTIGHKREVFNIVIEEVQLRIY